MPDIKKRKTTQWIKAVAASYGKRVGDIGYLFCDDEHILSVNREVISGDLVISLDTIRTNAELVKKPY